VYDKLLKPRQSFRITLHMYKRCVYIIGGFCKTIFPQILNRNTWCYCHLKEECLQFHSDLTCIRCAPHVWQGRRPDDTPIPAKPSQTCLVWRSRLLCWCALAILVVFLVVVGPKHCPWRNPTGRNLTLSGLVFVKIWFCKILR